MISTLSGLMAAEDVSQALRVIEVTLRVIELTLRVIELAPTRIAPTLRVTDHQLRIIRSLLKATLPGPNVPCEQ